MRREGSKTSPEKDDPLSGLSADGAHARGFLLIFNGRENDLLVHGQRLDDQGGSLLSGSTAGGQPRREPGRGRAAECDNLLRGLTTGRESTRGQDVESYVLDEALLVARAGDGGLRVGMQGRVTDGAQGGTGLSPPGHRAC